MKYVQLMQFFDLIQESTKEFAPVSPQDWEAVQQRLLKVIQSAHQATVEINLSLLPTARAEISSMIVLQCALMLTIELSVQLLPIGKSHDMADFHQELMRKRFKDWAKHTGELCDKMRLSNKHESSAVN